MTKFWWYRNFRVSITYRTREIDGVSITNLCKIK